MRNVLEIAIPTYNRSKALAFLLRDLFKNSSDLNISSKLSIFVLDNASTDDTKIILAQAQKNAKIFSINFSYSINQENMGFCFSYSEIVKKAKGKFLWIIGDDDCYNFYYLNQIIMFLEEKHPNNKFSCNAHFF